MTLSLRTLRLRVVWLVAVPLFLLSRPTSRLLVLGAVLAVAGVAIRAWAAGIIRKERELATAGPYAHTRNPLYLGSSLIGLGATIAGGRWGFVLFFCVSFALVYGPTIRGEADLLAERFGAHYADYARHVPTFVPRATPYRASSVVESAHPQEGFTLERWRRNREYEALMGVAAGFLFLAAKLLWM